MYIHTTSHLSPFMSTHTYGRMNGAAWRVRTLGWNDRSTRSPIKLHKQLVRTVCKPGFESWTSRLKVYSQYHYTTEARADKTKTKQTIEWIINITTSPWERLFSWVEWPGEEWPLGSVVDCCGRLTRLYLKRGNNDNIIIMNLGDAEQNSLIFIEPWKLKSKKE